MAKRKAKIARKTAETHVTVEVNLDGTGKGDVSTTIPFLDHMLDLLARHGFFDLKVRSGGDTDVDYHHLVEDVGICLGAALREALGKKEKINRYGSATVPMDESLCAVSLDISGRPYLVFKVNFGVKKIRDFDPALLRDFFKALTDHSGMTLHVNVMYGKNNHHIAESVFKAFARALSEAVSFNRKVTGVLSTKGSL
ncbi:MAG TPA: imidazoleglycerol-phosphate dehydratase HisB [Syntrophales bacterium]|nr:imidazoleglycerol-phosphate dehydratase HisB [Syntrophales bacterium]HOX94208.1 imidazoleglycerol-phosphate dehydratase HisB [Syntrophales bacterium]HPI58161.1 imidazoleglycerol-phosphate dehydratase HisB [Syntrophales bacterium]HPN25989.1 imidazoleglycerol-phosphate dehydratase HisB [Syntrophales bacterium]HQM30209.1 imidazoleglycerol-phosphate dehydratase HisB [Syntrophales bacterium]